MLADERRIGRREGKLEGIKEGKLEGIREGVEKGKLEGIKENSYTIAKSLKSSGLDSKFISEHTGLTIEEIRKLRPDGEKL